MFLEQLKGLFDLEWIAEEEALLRRRMKSLNPDINTLNLVDQFVLRNQDAVKGKLTLDSPGSWGKVVPGPAMVGPQVAGCRWEGQQVACWWEWWMLPEA